MKDALEINSKQPYDASEEFLEEEDPLIKQNISELLENILNEGGNEWKLLACLRSLKVSNPGFDFWVLYNIKTVLQLLLFI